MVFLRSFLIVWLISSTSLLAQQDQAWFFLLAKDSTFAPTFVMKDSLVAYNGTNNTFESILSKYQVYQFKKTQRATNLNTRTRKFFVRASSEKLLTDLLLQLPTIFESGTLFTDDEKKIFEPNDYGLTSTIGEAQGLPAYLDYYDFIGLPKAWYYTTGSRDVIIGVSDAILDTLHPDFKDKTLQAARSYQVKGHGYSISGNAAAQGNNGEGIAGVCYDCSLVGVGYGNAVKMSNVLDAANAGAKVVNCSWATLRASEGGQQVVNELAEKGHIIVASAGNKSWADTKGEVRYYPASYDNVISVSSVMYRYEDPLDAIRYQKNGKPYVENVLGFLSRTAGFKDHDLSKPLQLYPKGIATLNPEVDLLTPTVGLFAYSKLLLEDRIYYSEFETTSGASPLVSGTIGLMYSLCPCLPSNEVESILKMTAMNIDHIEVNKPYQGMYGAGILQTGAAVEMVYQLYQKDEEAYIENQHFSRWDFKLTAFNETLIMQNQSFTKTATLDLTARKKIVLKPNTILKPGVSGKIQLKIDPSLSPSCNLVLRDPSIVEKP